MVKNNKLSKVPEEHGVEDFIKKLRKKGVNEGKKKAEALITEAEERADKIIFDANKRAEEIIATAEATSSKLEQSAKDAIQIAFRDSILELKNNIQESFIKEIKHIVKKEVSDKKVIKEMIMKVVEESVSKDKTEILVADAIKEGDLDLAAYSVTKAMIKNGVELKTFISHDTKGILVKKSRRGIEVDLTDKSLSELLLEHLLPRYKNIMKEK